jgi:hypothetical protein
VLQLDGSAEGKPSFKIENPSSRPVSGTIQFETTPRDNQWSAALDHEHFELAAHESKAIQFDLIRVAGKAAQASLPRLRMELEYIGATARVKLPDIVTQIELTPGQVPIDFFANAQPRALQVSDEQSTIQIPADQISLPDGPMTLEAWIKPDDLTGYNAIIAKTEGSEFALFSDEGVPQFDIHLDGKYVTARAQELLPTERWTHVAGVFDGKQVMIFVDGQLIETVAGKGTRRTNQLPLFIGADPDRRGAPSRPFSGLIDEVRLSKAAVYQQEFKPERRLSSRDDTVLMLHLDKNIGPFVLDQSPSTATGVLRTNARLVPVSSD